ncbi:MAG: hypothetical protein JXA64_07325 [Candidatus Fermentibacteraceae bacterium]|nr:hypothetical protein [Candidatus Fermentibacteraceae bacterium]MBN2608911.1 hypothetical protein [Candidatus Fermentibacteraceae bacterium]
MSEIGLLNEKPLHASLKEWYSQPGDLIEVPVDGFFADILRGELLIEIQTGGFASIRHKLRKLLPDHQIRLVYPIALEKWIVKLPEEENGIISRRKSPKRGRVEELFREMVSFPHLFVNPNFSVEALLVREEEVRKYGGGRGRRRNGWVIEERRLIEVVDSRIFQRPEDWLALLPDELDREFTTQDLAEVMNIRKALAQKMAYCFRNAGIIHRIGKRDRSNLFVVSAGSP